MFTCKNKREDLEMVNEQVVEGSGPSERSRKKKWLEFIDGNTEVGGVDNEIFTAQKIIQKRSF